MATSRSSSVTTAPGAVSVNALSSSATVGRDVRTADSHVSWSISAAGVQAICVIAIAGTTSTSPSSDQPEASWLQPAVAPRSCRSNVSFTCVPSTSS